MHNNKQRSTKPKCYITSSHIQEPTASCDISGAQDNEGEVAISTYGMFSGF
jgi:hypothetical protein